MNKVYKIITLLFLLTGLTACHSNADKTPNIGIIVPLEHTAMNEIVDGFTETLHELYHQPIAIKIANAQNDLNLQRAIIAQMRDQQNTLIVPIGTSTTQMTQSMVRQTPIISLAADLADPARSVKKNCIALVRDEIPAAQQIAFIHAAYPTRSRITLIHSANDKVFPEINALKTAAAAFHITITTRMATSLPELITIAHALPNDTQGLLVLKDSLIVSGIRTLQKTAEQMHIPLITSDEGSVNNGAGLALGVNEREIGRAGAKLAAAILNGKNPCDLPTETMHQFTVFMRPESLVQTGQNPDAIKAALLSLHYPIQIVSGA